MKFQRGGKVVATCGGAFLGVAPLVGGIGGTGTETRFRFRRTATPAKS